MEETNRSIKYLTDDEWIRIRPNVYIGSVITEKENLLFVDDSSKMIVQKETRFNAGMHRLFVEALDNSIDEAKRCFLENSLKNVTITVSLDTNENKITIEDTGLGFKNPNTKLESTNMTELETAVLYFRSGTNFSTGDKKSNVIGVNGVGLSAIRALSKYFYISTKSSFNKESASILVTRDSNGENVDSKHKSTDIKKSGVKIEFIPDDTIFGKYKYNSEYIRSFLSMVLTSLNTNTKSKHKINIVYFVNGKEKTLYNIFQDNWFKFDIGKKNEDCQVFLTANTDNNSIATTFTNTSQCVGRHLDYIRNEINREFFGGNQKANAYYSIFGILNFNDYKIAFQDQIKSITDISLQTLYDILPIKFTKQQISNFKHTDIYEYVSKRLVELDNKKKVKEIKSKKVSLVSDKYFPSVNHENLFICEGLSALGSITQKRNIETDSIFAVRGRVRNAQNTTDITTNAELCNLINILNISLEGGEDNLKNVKYKKIVIASDEDFDGHAIAGGIINFFSKWFPELVENGMIYRLKLPLISYKVGNSKKYLYDMKQSVPEEAKEIRYLKGLGSLTVDDWETCFNKKMVLERFVETDNTEKVLNLLFSKDKVKARKNWLKK